MGTLRFRPDIEGLRGLAILLVVAYHVGIPGFNGGFIGVDVFFALSGYLITQLLLQELEHTSRIGLLEFYARRARRLLPAASAAIVGTLFLATLLYPPNRVMDVGVEAAAASVSASNLLFASQALDYFRGGTTSPLLHTWSLAVEEQFYLAWPVLLLLAAGRRADRGRLCAWLVVVIAVSASLCWWWTIAERPVAFYGTPFRAWEFAVGGLAACLPAGRCRTNGWRRAETAASWIGVGAIVWAAVAFTDRTTFPGLTAAIPVAGTVAVLLSAGSGGSHPGRVLELPAMQWLGRHSYGWYLWHWPLLVFGAGLLPGAGVVARLGMAGTALLIAAGSRRFIEEPVRRGSGFLSRPRRALAVAGGLVAAVALLGLGLREAGDAALARPEQARFAAARHDFHPCRPMEHVAGGVRVCTVGDTAAVHRVAIFGDSHAAHWVAALDSAARHNGWELLVIAKSSCPSVHVTLYEPGLNRNYDECDAWRAAALDTLKARRPAVVVLSNTTEYVVGGPYATARTRKSVSEWEAGLMRTAHELRSAGSRIVLIADTPRPPENVPDCLVLAAWRRQDPRRCDFPAATTLHAGVAAAELRVAERVAGTIRVDLNESLCGDGWCRAWDGLRVLYRDGNHLTSAAAQPLWPRLADAVTPQTGGD